MRVLVIGGTGFIGSHVVNQLIAEGGHETFVVHRGKSAGSKEPPRGARLIIGDRSKPADLARVMKETSPDAVIDMIPRTAQESWLLLRILPKSIARLVMVSSIDVYRAYNRLRKVESGPIDETPLKEEAPLRELLFPYRGNAIDALHLSYMYEKILVERLTMSEPELPATILRLPVTYGPEDPQCRIYDYLKRMIDKRPFILLGTKQATWRVTRGFVRDVAAAVARSIKDETSGPSVFNIGETDPVTEEEWVRSIGEAADWKGEILKVDEENLPGHLKQNFDWNQDLTIDTSRFTSGLGRDIEVLERHQALKSTVAWQAENPPSEKEYETIDYDAEDSCARSARSLATH